MLLLLWIDLQRDALTKTKSPAKMAASFTLVTENKPNVVVRVHRTRAVNAARQLSATLTTVWLSFE